MGNASSNESQGGDVQLRLGSENPPNNDISRTPYQLACGLASTYQGGAEPPSESAELVNSQMFKQLAKSVTVYHEGSEHEAKILATEREPVNIACRQLFDVEGLHKLTGWRESGYSRLYKDDPSKLPAMIAIYCQTPVLNQPKVVHVINSIGIALDSPDQPDYKYFKATSFENVKRRLAQTYRMVFRCAKDRGLARVVLSCVGGGAFSKLYPGDYMQDVFVPALQDALSDAVENSQLPDHIGVMGAESDPVLTNAVQNAIQQHGLDFKPYGFVPAILDNDRTLYQNAWDPHSIVGNGNAADNSLDGYFGRCTMMHFLCWPLTNSDMQFVQMHSGSSSSEKKKRGNCCF